MWLGARRKGPQQKIHPGQAFFLSVLRCECCVESGRDSVAQHPSIQQESSLCAKKKDGAVRHWNWLQRVKAVVVGFSIRSRRSAKKGSDFGYLLWSGATTKQTEHWQVATDKIPTPARRQEGCPAAASAILEQGERRKKEGERERRER